MKWLVLVALSCVAWAQEGEEPPIERAAPTPPPLALPPAPPAAAEPVAVVRATSTQGGATLGPGRFGLSALLGFPMIEVQAGVGLGTRFDLSINYDTYYLLMHEFGLTARLELFEVSGFRLLLSLRGSGALFVDGPSTEARGARWLTGRRNFNASPGVIVSYQGRHERAVRLSLEARYLLAVATQQPEPLLGHNVIVRGIAELPLSQRVAFIFALGLSVHSRVEDSILMPSASIGITVDF